MSRISTSIALTVLAQALVLVTPEPFLLSVEQGLSKFLDIEVRNDGSIPVTYQFVSQLPVGVDIAVALADGVYTRTLAPGVVDALSIGVLVGKSVPAGDYTIGIELT